MIQIAIWGIAFMLVVKALDILHQQRMATAAGYKGGPIVAGIAIVLAFLFALILFVASADQANRSPSPPSFGSP